MKKLRLLNFKNTLGAISTFCSILPIAACLFRLPLVNRRFYAILIYCIFSLFTDLSLKYIHLKAYPNLQFFLLSSFTIIEYSLYAFFVYHALLNKTVRLIVLLVSVPFVIYCVIYYTKNKLTTFDWLPVSIESLVIIIFCIYYFFEQINIPTTNIIYSGSTFWMIIGILFYFSGTLFLYLYVASLPEGQTFKFWFISNVFNILNKFLLTIGFLINKDNGPAKMQVSNQNYL